MSRDQDFQQLGGRFDGVMIPSQDFSERMKALMADKLPSIDKATPSQPVLVPKPTARVMPRATGDSPAARRNHPLAVAATVFVTLALVAMSIVVVRDTAPGNQSINNGDASLTLASDTAGTPSTDVTLKPQRFIETATHPYLDGPYDDVLITNGYVELEDGTSEWSQTAYDIRTGQVLWDKPNSNLGEFTQVGDYLVANTWIPPEPEIPEGELKDELEEWGVVLLDLYTGDVIWQHVVPTKDGEYVRSPFIVGTNVIALTSEGIVLAWDVLTGEPQWEQTVDAGTGIEQNMMTFDADGKSTSFTALVKEVSAIGLGNQVVVINGDGVVTIVNAADGTIAGIQQIPGTTIGAFDGSVSLYQAKSGILISATSGYTLASYWLLYHPDDNSVSWQRELSGYSYQGYVNGTVLINTAEWIDVPWYVQIFGKQGHAESTIHWVDGATGGDILTVGPMRGVDDSTGVMGITNGAYACFTTDKLTCIDRAGTNYVLDERAYSLAFSDDMLYFSTDDGIYAVNLP